jgi:glycosyltransferase involved in cell wall biosynthesis
MYRLKKQWFTGVKDMTLVTPSHWLADLVKQSYLKEYPVKVIGNGIDLSVFRPTHSDFRQRYGIAPEKKILLGVASGWSEKKGLDVFAELVKRLDDSYQIVLVGTNEIVDQQLPQGILSIHRTENQQQLAQIYTAADLFVNPTREDTYPTVNMEALACGTPVLTFRTGGSPEIPDATCGAVVEKDDVDAMEKEILSICRDEPYCKEACLKRAEQFDMNLNYKEYVQLYEDCTYCAQCTL